jgi:hypothetical protein
MPTKLAWLALVLQLAQSSQKAIFFPKFNPEKAQSVIDQADVDGHIAELHHQLAATKSVFGWVNTYNKYIAFFICNFGRRPTACCGQDCIDDIVDTLARIQWI